MLKDGTVVSAGTGPARLALPVRIEGSYAVRYACRLARGESISVHLPLAERSALFTLGAAGRRYSGVQWIDGVGVESSKISTSMSRKTFRLQRDTAVAIELHVELVPEDRQSSKMKRLTSGEHWTRIVGKIDGAPLVAVEGATARFSTVEPARFAAGTLGFATHAACSYGHIELMRK